MTSEPDELPVGDDGTLGEQDLFSNNETASESAEAAESARVLPAANDFGPNNPSANPITLGKLLQLVYEHEGSRTDQAEAIRAEYFANSAAQRSSGHKQLLQQQQMARNVLIGLENYKLYDEGTAKLTEFGDELRKMPDEPTRRSAFARHILLNLHGLEILRIILEMQAASREVSKVSLVAELNRAGFRTTLGGLLPSTTVNHLRLLQWLRVVGILPDKGYEIDEERVKEIAGRSIRDASSALNLTSRQRIFLQAVRRDFELNGRRLVLLRELRARCQLAAPHLFDRTDNLAKAIVKPLEADGWIVEAKKSDGRGGVGQISSTEKLEALDPNYLSLPPPGGIPPEVRRQLLKPLAETYAELSDPSTSVKGLALEALAVRIVYELGLDPVRFRERGAENDGAEVDLIAEGADLHFHRWMVQCKNTKTVNVGALAKEIGMAVIYRAQVVFLVTTGKFTQTVHIHAKELAETSALQAILLDGDALRVYVRSGVIALFEHLSKNARDVLTWKRSQLAEH